MNKAEFMLQGDRKLNSTEFNPKEWEEYPNAGCYPYALDWKIDRLLLVGELLESKCSQGVSAETLITFLMHEQAALGYQIDAVDVKHKCKEGEKKIYLQYFPKLGSYHMLREDSDGTWSHKYPNEPPSRKDSADRIIENPEEMAEEAPFCGWCFLLKKRMS